MTRKPTCSGHKRPTKRGFVQFGHCGSGPIGMKCEFVHPVAPSRQQYGRILTLLRQGDFGLQLLINAGEAELKKGPVICVTGLGPGD